MRLRLISCEIFFREMCALIARSPHTIDVEFLPKGLSEEEVEAAIEAEQKGREAAAVRP